MFHRVFPGAVLVALAASFWAPEARANKKGDEVLALMDAAMTRAVDQRFVYDVVTQEPGKKPRTLTIEVTVKGDKWRRIDFLAPGDVKGMTVLVRSKSKMYVYLPAYRKVRRVASHVKAQGFMGTTFSQDEMSTVKYSPHYSARLLREDKDHWVLELERKKGAEVLYKKLEMDVLKKYHQPSEIRYFNDKGQKVKTETRTGYSCQGKVCNAAVMRMTRHARNDTWSEFRRKKWTVNTGVSDRFFTLRSVQRGH